MGEISLLVAFSGGRLTFLSPCVIPLVPVYLASLCGPEIFNTDPTTFFIDKDGIIRDKKIGAFAGKAEIEKSLDKIIP